MKKTRLVLAICLAVSMAGCNDDLTIDVKESPSLETPTNLPLDPGKAGKATIEGVDADDDGVRDDVQIAIHQRHSDNEEARKALRQQAMSLQSAIIAGAAQDQAQIFEAVKLVMDAVDCIFASTTTPSEEVDFVRLKMVNTEARGEAYRAFNQALDGQFFGDGSDAPCQSQGDAQ